MKTGTLSTEQSIVQASWNVSYQCVIIRCVGNSTSRTVCLINRKEMLNGLGELCMWKNYNTITK